MDTSEWVAATWRACMHSGRACSASSATRSPATSGTARRWQQSEPEVAVVEWLRRHPRAGRGRYPMKHTYYQPVAMTSRWRLPEALPGRRSWWRSGPGCRRCCRPASTTPCRGSSHLLAHGPAHHPRLHLVSDSIRVGVHHGQMGVSGNTAGGQIQLVHLHTCLSQRIAVSVEPLLDT